MASVVTVKPSKALDRFESSQYVKSKYGSDSGSSTQLQNDVESAYGSESGIPTELQNDVDSAYGNECRSNTEL